MRKLTGIIFCIAMGISLLAHAADYELTARVDIEASDGKLKSIVTSSLRSGLAF